MNCKKAKDFFLDYQDLSEVQRRFLQEHFESCPECFKGFETYKASLGLLKQTMDFQPPSNFWEKFSLKLKAYQPAFNLKSYFQEKIEYLLSVLQTPLLGPVPAYVFSIALLVFATLGFSSLFKSGRYTPGNLVNNLIIYEGQLLSAKDDGFLTIYTVSRK